MIVFMYSVFSTHGVKCEISSHGLTFVSAKLQLVDWNQAAKCKEHLVVQRLYCSQNRSLLRVLKINGVIFLV